MVPSISTSHLSPGLGQEFTREQRKSHIKKHFSQMADALKAEGNKAFADKKFDDAAYG